MTWELSERIDWRRWTTPKEAKSHPVHRWYLFPHSYSRDLVYELIDEWNLKDSDKILDPFAGSGTTLLSAKEKAVPCEGYDLSPLAVLASNTKIGSYFKKSLQTSWRALEGDIKIGKKGTMKREYSNLVRSALPEGRLEELDAIRSYIEYSDIPHEERDFFLLALLSVIPSVSHAVADGGWLRWRYEGACASEVKSLFFERVNWMLEDVSEQANPADQSWNALLADARFMPAKEKSYSAVITSPPYPNRHDYTRVFGVELMFAFQDWDSNRRLRYQTFHSHPEAHPIREEGENYSPPDSLTDSLAKLKERRIQRMLEGYFLDMYLCLREIARVCCQSGKVALVLGNARYEGETILVDEISAEIGEQVGLRCDEIRAVRWRGNSAQQMGAYGREAARESIVMFERD